METINNFWSKYKIPIILGLVLISAVLIGIFFGKEISFIFTLISGLFTTATHKKLAEIDKKISDSKDTVKQLDNQVKDSEQKQAVIIDQIKQKKDQLDSIDSDRTKIKTAVDKMSDDEIASILGG